MRRRNLIIAIVTVLLLLSASAYITRAWLRGTVVPAYVSHFYWSGVEKTFKNNFNSLDSELQQFGATFKTIDSGCRKGAYEVRFEGFRETIFCIKQRGGEIPLDSASLAKWKSEAPQFEKSLLQNGWHKDFNAKQPIATIFDGTPDITIGVNYYKAYGQTSCYLSINYTSYVTMENPTESQRGGFVGESCIRYVSFFGGVK